MSNPTFQVPNELTVLDALSSHTGLLGQSRATAWRGGIEQPVIVRTLFFTKFRIRQHSWGLRTRGPCSRILQTGIKNLLRQSTPPVYIFPASSLLPTYREGFLIPYENFSEIGSKQARCQTRSPKSWCHLFATSAGRLWWASLQFPRPVTGWEGSSDFADYDHPTSSKNDAILQAFTSSLLSQASDDPWPLG